MSPSRTNIFVSHNHSDDDDVKRLVSNIRDKGFDVSDYSVTLDKPNDANDENYIKYKILAPKIDLCSVVAVVVSPETKNSHYVNWEIEYAQRHNKRIVAIYENGAKGCDLPEALGDCFDSIVAWDTNKIIRAIDGENFTETEDGVVRRPRNVPPAPC